ncbi:MAG: NADH-quinone oxidoreductase subunit L [Candidatus Hydrogenedentes bacterium]|nr:NADH-quinone oxidoreductase subunit L [Candidatus Hydrogenedentota bacterium]
MLELLWVIPAAPLAGFLVLTLFGSRLRKPAIAMIGAGSVGLSAAIGIMLSAGFLDSPPAEHAYTQHLWTWMNVAGYVFRIALYFDALALVMTFVVACVGFLILVYSVQYMADDDGYARFFAYMDLFVGSMLILVLADDLLLLYLGWEGVGLCSYLLIGFWYKNPANARAAVKAFLVTRIGDTAMAIGLLLLASHFHTLRIQEVMQGVKEQWSVGSGLAVAAAALMLGGALGKSGQVPLQVWLPDAMAGPTPVSALIHAATMVTAGVYLIARTHVLFEWAPVVQSAVAAIGAVTLLLAGMAALAQRDIKRVLAYSTISQIGYMFLALGVGAWSAAIFHLVTHAFFKALLFMAAGVVILSLHHEQDLFKMGGLRKQMPLVFWSFLVGALSLTSLPLVTAGFYSKDLILWMVWSSPLGGPWLWLAGSIGAFVTAIYTFRMVFLAFFGETQSHVTPHRGSFLLIPIAVLAALSMVGGFIELPRTLGHLPLFSKLVETALPPPPEAHYGLSAEAAFQVVAGTVVLAGMLMAWLLFLRSPQYVRSWSAAPWGVALHRFLASGCGFDWAYNLVFVRPFVRLAEINRSDFIDSIYTSIAGANLLGHVILSRTQTGQLRWYMMGIVAGAALTVALAVLL